MENQTPDNNQHQFIYPVPFEEFVNYRKKQSQAIISGFNIKELNKIRKLKKLLESTQQKICNRIKLFKKVSMDLQKKKQKQNMLHERIEHIKKDQNQQQNRSKQHGSSYLKSTKSSACGIRIRHTNTDSQKNDQNIKKHQVILQQKIDHAKQIKLWKEHNKILVEQRKTKQMREKMQSANAIRNNRGKAKQIKIQWEQDRFDSARKAKELKFRTQIEKYDELQANLTKLQRQERQALIMWKRAMESS